MAKTRTTSARARGLGVPGGGAVAEDRPTPEPMARAATQLREAHLRVTAQRMAVFSAVEQLSGHPNVEAIRTRAQEITGRLSVQAVYNVLDVLTNAGLVRCTHIASFAARYEIERCDNHHHFVCRRCGEIINTDCVVGEAPCLEARLPSTYKVDEASVTFWGECPRCALLSTTPQP